MRSLRAPALLLLALGACGAPCADEAPIVAIDFVGPGPDAGLEIDGDTAQADIARRAQDLPGFEVRRGRLDEVGWQLTVRTQLATERTADDEPARVRRALGMTAELRRLKPYQDSGKLDRYAAEVVEVRTMPRGSPSAPLVAETLDTLLRRLRTSIELASADPEGLAEAIEGPDDHARAVAIGIARARQLRAVRPALERRLLAEGASPQEALRIAGALGTLGDPAAASALIEAISRYPQHTIPLLFVLGQVGGREAAGYLFTVQSGHEDPGVRVAAREALEAAEARGAADAE